MSIKYEYDVLLEMLGGYTYYTKEQIDYIYYDVNKLDPIETKILLDQCLENANIIKKKYSKLVSSVPKDESVEECKTI
jgi:hypothetical protein